MLISLLLVLTAATLSAAASSLRLLHRINHPSAPQSPFAERGTLHLESATFQPSKDANNLQFDASFTDGALYQIALEREGDSSEALWDISSVKLCHLYNAVSDLIILHATEAHNPEPYALDYFISPIPKDGSCPRSKSKSKKHQAQANTDDDQPIPAFTIHDLANKLAQMNSTVSIRTPKLPPLPELRIPPPLNAEGEPIKPVPEKSFIQKYWMYIVAVLIALLMTGGPEEEGTRRGNQQQ